jgi:5-methylcytosine-specific restriction endonuclease McrA
MAHSTLLLNSTYEPLKVISWQRAVSLWFTDKVEIVEEYDDFDLKSVSFTMKCPAVVRLVSYVRGTRNRVKFSRVNVFQRDHFTCVYCGAQPGTRELTFDHVLPRSRGGKTMWTNIVTACLPCNHKKADKTPEEAKMKLRKKPEQPPVRKDRFVLNIPKTPDAWRDYIYWNQELANDNE